MVNLLFITDEDCLLKAQLGIYGCKFLSPYSIVLENDKQLIAAFQNDQFGHSSRTSYTVSVPVGKHAESLYGLHPNGNPVRIFPNLRR